MAISEADNKRVKGMGFLRNRGTDCYNGRIITENGVVTAEQTRVISEAAAKYGSGTVSMTSRLTIEIPGIHYDNIPAFQEYIAQAQLVTGGTGSKVRPVVACKGTTCIYGLVDTQGIAKEIHSRFYEGYRNVVLPHKFKIAIGGCPNNCIKPDLNDLGIIGQRVPIINNDLCKGCKVCKPVDNCPLHIFKNDYPGLHFSDECNNCGICTGNCPFNAIYAEDTKYKVYVGGRWGKKVRHGDPLETLFTKEEALDVVEKSILLFKSQGISGERFADTIERIGIKKVEKMLVSDRLLQRKDEILQIETVAGAKC